MQQSETHRQLNSVVVASVVNVSGSAYLGNPFDHKPHVFIRTAAILE